MSGARRARRRRGAGLAWLGLALLLVACPGRAELEPRSGRAEGGEWVILRGHDFASHGGVVVRFGGVPARGVVIESDTTMRVATPSVPPPLRGQALEVELRFADGVTRTLASTYLFETALAF